MKEEKVRIVKDDERNPVYTPARSCPIYDGGMPIGVVCKPLAEEQEATS